MSLEVVNNVPDIIEDFAKLSDKARYLLSNQILEDSNKHARKQDGNLILSSKRFSNLDKGELVWNTPYAKRVYYTGTPDTTKGHNPDAQLMWVHFARDRYKEDWLVIFRNVYEKYT